MMTLPTQAWAARRGSPGPAAHRLEPVTNHDFDYVKPKRGGLWTSTWDATFGGGWIDWCISESFAGPDFQVWLLDVDPAARLYHIDSHDDLCALLHRFPGRGRVPGVPMLDYPNWEAVAEVYDGVHLTDGGQWATRLSSPHLYGWDCECTLWFRWAFTDVRLYGTWTAPKLGFRY